MFVSTDFIQQFIHTNPWVVLRFKKVLEGLAGEDWVVLGQSWRFELKKVRLEFDVDIYLAYSLALRVLATKSVIWQSASMLLTQPPCRVVRAFVFVSYVDQMLNDFVEIVLPLACLDQTLSQLTRALHKLYRCWYWSSLWQFAMRMVSKLLLKALIQSYKHFVRS